MALMWSIMARFLMHELISKEDAAKVVDWLTERYLAFYLESNNGLFASSDFQERARETLKTYAIQKGQSEESVAGKKPYLGRSR